MEVGISLWRIWEKKNALSLHWLTDGLETDWGTQRFKKDCQVVTSCEYKYAWNSFGRMENTDMHANMAISLRMTLSICRGCCCIKRKTAISWFANVKTWLCSCQFGTNTNIWTLAERHAHLVAMNPSPLLWPFVNKCLISSARSLAVCVRAQQPAAWKPNFERNQSHLARPY
jgi:hypothetical protein